MIKEALEIYQGILSKIASLYDAVINRTLDPEAGETALKILALEINTCSILLKLKEAESAPSEDRRQPEPAQS